MSMFPNSDYSLKLPVDNTFMNKPINIDENSTYTNSLFLNDGLRPSIGNNLSDERPLIRVNASSNETFDSGVNTQLYNLNVRSNNIGVQYTQTNVTGLCQSSTQAISLNLNPFENLSFNISNSKTDYANCSSSTSSGMSVTWSGALTPNKQNVLNNDLQPSANPDNADNNEHAENTSGYNLSYAQCLNSNSAQTTFGAGVNLAIDSKTSIQANASNTQISMNTPAFNLGMNTQTYTLGVQNGNAGIAYTLSNTTGLCPSYTQEIDANYKKYKICITDTDMGGGAQAYSAKLTYGLNNGELGLGWSKGPDGSEMYSLSCRVAFKSKEPKKDDKVM